MADAPAQAQHLQRQQLFSRPLSALGAPLTRAILQLDGALVSRLSAPAVAQQSALVRLEALLLWRSRMGLVAHLRAHDSTERVDPVVAENLLEAIDHAQALMGELAAGGLGRVFALWQGCREIAAELAALGVDTSADKNRIKAQRTALTEQKSTLEAAENQAIATGMGLSRALRAYEPARPRSAIEELLTAMA